MEIRAKLSLNPEGFVKGAKQASGAVKELGESADKAGKSASQGLTNAEKSAVGAARAIANFRRSQAQSAGASRSGSELGLEMLAFGRDRYNKMAAEERSYQRYLNNLANMTAIAEKRMAVTPRVNMEELERAAPRIRYALYDVGTRALGAAAAITGFGVAAVTAFAKFESAFTSVERTTGLAGGQLENLRTQLIDLSTTVPVSFEDIARIATLGAQMGIASESLGEFTKTVSEFSTITGISVEETAQAFGRLAQLMNVPVEQFKNLSSAVAFAGVNAVATDREIITMSESIAATGTQAGLSADEVVGFATALASLKVRPEEARGVLVRLFRTIDLAVSESGTALDDFSKVLGLTANETSSLWRQDPSQFVQAFLSGAKAGDQLNSIITALGITNTRELNVIQRLAGSTDMLKSSLDDASTSFALGTYATEAYGKVLDDLQSRITVLNNSFQALVAEVGGPLGEFLKPIIVILTDIVNGMRKFAEQAPALSALVTIFAVLAGTFLAIKAGFALAIAGLLAFMTAVTGLNGSLAGMKINMSTVIFLLKQLGLQLGLTGTAATGNTVKFATLAATMTRYGASATAATFATRALSVALGPVGWAIAGVGLALSMVDWDAATKGSNSAGQAMIDAAGGAEALMNAVAADTATGTGLRKIEMGVRSLTDAEIEKRRSALEAAVAQNKSNIETKKGEENYKIAKKALDEFNAAVASGNEVLGENTAVLGENTAAFILNGLSKLDDGTDYWKRFTALPAGTQAALEKLGFSAAEMVNAGLQEGGETAEQYAERYANALDYIRRTMDRSSGSIAELLGQEYNIKIDASGVERLRAELRKTEGDAGNYRDVIIAGAKGVTQQTGAIVENISSQELLKSSLNEVGFAASDTEGEIQSLSDLMVKYTKAALAGITSSAALNGSFGNVASSIEGINGPLTTLTGEGREAIGAWASFINDSIDFAISNGGDFNTAVANMVNALTVLENSGKDTSVQFKMFKDVIIQNVIATSPLLRAYASEIDSALNIKDLKGKLEQRILLAKADAVLFLGKGDVTRYTQLMNDVTNLQKTVDGLSGSAAGVTNFSKVYEDAMKKADKSSGKAKTALEKLLEKIRAATRYTNLFANLRGSLDSFGDSLRENGRSFDSFSETGRSNISSLQSVINDLAERSGGNVKKFADDLVSFRKVLADAGVPAAGLKIIDNILKGLGVKGKVSAASIKELKKALGEVGKQEASLLKIVEATNKIAQAATSALEANFAYSNSIDEVTLGWESMADAQRQAAEQMANLKEEALDAADAITEAKLAIDEANASIGELTANRSKLEYQLQIAIKYGDSLRAQEIGAKIAAIDADVASERNKIADANKNILQSQEKIAEVNAEINRPRSATEIINENRALRDMAGRYANVTAYMMMNAEEGTDLNKVVNDQVEAFRNTAVQMGYTQEQANAVAAVLRDSLIPQIDAVKQAKIDLGITVDTDTATSDLNGFVATANSLLEGITTKTIKVNTPPAVAAVTKAVADINARLNNINDRTIVVTTVHQSTGGSALGVIRRASGGLVTGPGTATSDSIAARLSNGEYVVKTAAVKHYGVDFMNALNNMSLQSASLGGPSISVAGSQTVHLSSEDRQLLRAAIDRPIALYTDNATIAKSANDGNSILAQRGIR